jgi:hypothetical protein
MGAISVSGAVGEGFSLIRRQPGAVALWALVTVGFLALRVALSLPVYLAMFAQIARGGATPDMTALLPQIQQTQALGLLLSLLSLMLSAVVTCAVFRAVLHPEQSGFGYMRVGSAEIFLFVFIIAAVIVLMIGAVVVTIPLVIVGGLVAQSAPAGAAVFGIIAVCAVMAGVIYLVLRFSLIGPMMVDDGQFNLGAAWTLTRGKVGSLFLIALLLVVVLLVGEVVLVGVGFALLGTATVGFTQLRGLFEGPPQAMFAQLGPVLAVLGILWLIFVACLMPIFYAPWARAYRDLKQNDLAAAFS